MTLRHQIRVLLDKTLVIGFCTARGSATSHTAILARGLGIPAVAGAGDEVLKQTNGTGVILDGTKGVVVPCLLMMPW